MAARKNLGMYDALFVQLTGELDLPLLTTDTRLRRAAEGLVRIEVLQGKRILIQPDKFPPCHSERRLE